jgi:hypothetical protein
VRWVVGGGRTANVGEAPVKGTPAILCIASSHHDWRCCKRQAPGSQAVRHPGTRSGAQGARVCDRSSISQCTSCTVCSPTFSALFRVAYRRRCLGGRRTESSRGAIMLPPPWRRSVSRTESVGAWGKGHSIVITRSHHLVKAFLWWPRGGGSTTALLDCQRSASEAQGNFVFGTWKYLRYLGDMGTPRSCWTASLPRWDVATPCNLVRIRYFPVSQSRFDSAKPHSTVFQNSSKPHTN